MIGAAFGFWAYWRGFQAGDHVCREIGERVNIFIEKCNSVRMMCIYPLIAFIKEKVFIFNEIFQKYFCLCLGGVKALFFKLRFGDCFRPLVIGRGGRSWFCRIE